MNTIKKHKWLWLITIIFVLPISIFLLWKIQNSFLIPLLFIVIVLVLIPFIYLVNKYINRDKNNEFKSDFLGVPFKNFATAWTALFGLFFIAGGIIQVQRQISNQDKQIQIQEKQFSKQLCNTRFSSGIELLGSQNESTRIGGAYSLYFLANEYFLAKEYDELIPICEILCAHIRHNLLKKISKEEQNIEEYMERDYSIRKISNEFQILTDLLFLKENQNKELIFDICIKNLKGISIRKIDFNHTILSNVDFSDTDFEFIKFKNAKLDSVDFLSREYFNSASLCDVDFENAALCNVNFGGSRLTMSKFTNAKLSNVDFSNAILKPLGDLRKKEIIPESEVYFENATLSNVSFERAKLVGSKFTNAILSNVDFSNAILEGEIDFTGTVLAGYSYEEITREGRSLELTKATKKR